MEHYVDALLAIVDKEKEPVILVGHSFNAITVSRVAELRPSKIKHLVFLAGVIPTAGASFMDMAAQLESSVAVENVYFSEDGTQALVKQEAVKEAFMHDVSDEFFARIAPKIVPEPAAPLHYVLEVSDENYGQVTKHYIQCQFDKAIPVGDQWQMYFNKVNTARGIDSSHTPNFSKPNDVAEILLQYQ
jgi:pimeloyl-ACP methyl ester carboxylesterase